MWAAIITTIKGDPETFVLNAYLLSFEALAAIACACGIVWESRGGNLQEITHKLVVWGVVAEVVFSVTLFLSDEIVSAGQLVKIFALETELAPRKLTKEQADFLIQKASAFAGQQYLLSVAPGAEPEALLCQLHGILHQYAAWVQHPPYASITIGTDCIDRPNVGVNFASGIHIRFRQGSPPQVSCAADAVAQALRAAQLEVYSEFDDTNVPESNTISIMVGAKL
jgi:hypothetical protein